MPIITPFECVQSVPPPPPPPPPSKFPPPPPLVSSLTSRTPTRRLQWTKIPEVVVKNGVNVWNIVEKSKPKLDVDTNKIEQLFSYKVASQEKPLKQCKLSSPLLSLPAEDASDGIFNGDSGERNSFCDKRRRVEEINLLDFTRSRNVCIFLRSLNMSNQQVLVHLSAFDWQAFDTDTLKSLVRLLPTEQECQLLISFKGDTTRLGLAERFFLSFFKLPNYQLIAKLLLTTQELQQLIDIVIPAIASLRQCVIEACESEALRNILHLVLAYGNLLNSGATVGCAVGFSISSLPTLTDLKSNDHRTLMHIIAEEAVLLNPAIVEGVKKLKTQTSSSRTNISSTIQDLTRMKSTFDADVKTLFDHNGDTNESNSPLNVDRILTLKKNIGNRCGSIEREWKEIEALQQQTAAFFCEDDKKFTLESFIDTIHDFSLKFLKAHQDNVERSAKMEEKKRKEHFRRGSHVLEKRNTQPNAEPSHSSNKETNPVPNGIIKINIENNGEDNMDCASRKTMTRARSASCRAGTKHEEENDELIGILLKTQPKFTGSLRRRSKNNCETNNSIKNNLNINFSRERVLEHNLNNCSNTNTNDDSFSSNNFVRNNPLRSTCPSNLKIHSLTANRNNNLYATDNKLDDDYNDILRRAGTYKKQICNGREFEKAFHENIASGAASFEKKMKELEDSLSEFDMNSVEQEKIYLNKNNSMIFYESNNNDQISFIEKNIRDDCISMNSCTTSNVDTSSCSIDLNQTPSPPHFDSNHNDNDSGVSVGENTTESYDKNQKYDIVNEGSKEIINDKLSKKPSSEKSNNKKISHKLEPQKSPPVSKNIMLSKETSHFQRSRSLRTKIFSDPIKSDTKTKNPPFIFSPKPFRKSTLLSKTCLPTKHLSTPISKHQTNDKVPCKPASRVAVNSINTTSKNHLHNKLTPETNKAAKINIQKNKTLRSFSEIRTSKETKNLSVGKTTKHSSNNINNKTKISKANNYRSYYALQSTEKSSLKKFENNTETEKLLKGLPNSVKAHAKKLNTQTKKPPTNSLSDENSAQNEFSKEEEKVSRPSRPRFNFLSSSTLTSATLSRLNKATTVKNISKADNKTKLLNSNDRNKSIKAHRSSGKCNSTDSDKTPSENTPTLHSFNRSSLRRKTLPYRISDNNRKNI